MSEEAFSLRSPSPEGRRAKRVPIDPTPRFKVDQENQCDVILGHLESQVPSDHVARALWSILGGFDTSEAEQRYSALGRRGYPPKRLLAVWVYASLVGEHEASKVAARCKTDVVFRWLCGGHSPSPATLKRFRQRNGALFARGLQYTVELAVEMDLVDPQDVAVDSVRLRAHASRDAVRTVKRSKQRLSELRSALSEVTSAEEKKKLKSRIRKHEEALARCEEEGRSNVVLTNETAGLMKFPHGTSAPGHRATVAAAGLNQRIVLSVLVDSDAHDYGHLVDSLTDARDALRDAGHALSAGILAVADAGYFSREDLQSAAREHEWLDVIVAPSTPDRNPKYFGRNAFSVPEQGPPLCPAGTAMEGPTQEPHGRQRWTGVGCPSCPLRPQCTRSNEARSLTLVPELEAMRRRMQEPEAIQRYNRRIGTIEPVFAKVEHDMRFRRLSSRDAQTIQAEILLKFLAYNISRLISARRLAVFHVVVEIF